VANTGAPLAVWRSVRALPEFWRLLELRSVSQFGDGLFQAALAGAILFNPDRAAEPLAIAGAFAVLFLPYSVLGPFAGALLDRWDRRLVLIAAGGIEEARVLMNRGLPPDLPAMKGVGVPELMRHLRSEITLEEAVAAAQRATRRYAKRQMTWFRHQIIADLVFDQQLSPSMLRQANDLIDQFLLTHPA